MYGFSGYPWFDSSDDECKKPEFNYATTISLLLKVNKKQINKHNDDYSKLMDYLLEEYNTKELSKQDYKDIKKVHLKFNGNIEQDVKLIEKYPDYLVENFNEEWFLNMIHNHYYISTIEKNKAKKELENATYYENDDEEEEEEEEWETGSDYLYDCNEEEDSGYSVIYNFIKNNISIISKELSIKIIDKIIEFINGCPSRIEGNPDGFYLIYTILLFKGKIGLNGYVQNINIFNALCKYIDLISLHLSYFRECFDLDHFIYDMKQFINEEEILIDVITQLLVNNNNKEIQASIQKVLVQSLYFCSKENQYAIYNLIYQDTDLVINKSYISDFTKEEFRILTKRDIGFMVEPLVKKGLFTIGFFMINIKSFKGYQYDHLMKLGVNQCIQLFRKSIESSDENDYFIRNGHNQEPKNDDDKYLSFDKMGIKDNDQDLYEIDESLIIYKKEKEQLEEYYKSSMNKIFKNFRTYCNDDSYELFENSLKSIVSNISNNPIRRSVFLSNISTIIVLSNLTTVFNLIYSNFEIECNQLISTNSIVKDKLLNSIHLFKDEPLPQLPLYLIKDILSLSLQQEEQQTEGLDFNITCPRIALLSKGLYRLSKTILKSISAAEGNLTYTYNRSPFFKSLVGELESIIFIGQINNYRSEYKFNKASVQTILIKEVSTNCPVLSDFKPFPNIKLLILKIDVHKGWSGWDYLKNNSKSIKELLSVTKVEIHLNITKKDFTKYNENNSKHPYYNFEYAKMTKSAEIQGVIEREDLFESKHKFIDKFKSTENLNLNLITSLNVNIGSFLRIYYINQSITNIRHLKINASKYFSCKSLEKFETITYHNQAKFEILDIYFENPRSIQRILNIFESIPNQYLKSIRFYVLFANEFRIGEIKESKHESPLGLSKFYSTIFSIIATSKQFTSVNYISIQDSRGNPLLASWNNVNLFSFSPSLYNFTEFTRSNLVSQSKLPPLPESELYGNDLDEDGSIFKNKEYKLNKSHGDSSDDDCYGDHSYDDGSHDDDGYDDGDVGYDDGSYGDDSCDDEAAF